MYLADADALQKYKEAGNEHVIWSEDDNKQIRVMAREAWGIWRDKSPMAKRMFESQVSFMKKLGLID